MQNLSKNKIWKSGFILSYPVHAREHQNTDVRVSNFYNRVKRNDVCEFEKTALQ